MQAYSKHIKSIQIERIFIGILIFILYIEEETKQYKICIFNVCFQRLLLAACQAKVFRIVFLRNKALEEIHSL